MEEKKSFKQRVASMSAKRKIVALLIILLIVAVPIGAVAYQLNHKKNNSKTVSKNGKTSPNKSSNSSKSSKDQANNSSGGSPAAGKDPQSRLERFNKEALSKRIDQALQGKRITDAQAKALNKKLAEISKFVESNKSKNVQDQNKAASDKRKELQKWANDNNLNVIFFGLQVTNNLHERSYVSEFERNADKYGFKFDAGGKWYNDTWSRNSVLEFSAKLNPRRRRLNFAGFNHVALHTLGYTNEEILSQNQEDIRSSAEFAERKKKFLTEYWNKINAL